MLMQLLIGVWFAVLAAFVTVALMRWIMGRREDDHLHFADSEQQLVTTQSSIAHKLDVLDRWKAVLLTLTIVLAVLIGAIHFYMVWNSTGGNSGVS